MPRKLTTADLIDLPNGKFGFSGSGIIDLSNVEPLETTLSILDRAAAESVETVYPIIWINRLCASGCSVSVSWVPLRDGDNRQGARDGEFIERLMVLEPCDGHELARRERVDALYLHLHAQAGARQAVVDRVNRAGLFYDDRPFASAAEAVEQMLGVNQRLMLNRDGKIETCAAVSGELFDGEHANGHPLRRAHQRFRASCRKRGWKAEIINIIRQRGALHEGSGWIVLEGEKAA